MPPEADMPACRFQFDSQAEVIVPDWPVPPRVRALMSTRRGGVGEPPFDSFNLALDPRDAAAPANRQRWAGLMEAQPVWLQQVHGTAVAVLTAEGAANLPAADASVTAVPGLACTVMVADCLPVLLYADDGRAVGAAHAGWRGLAGGVLEQTVQALCRLAGCGPDSVQAWLGPCIGPRQFEVGEDVLQAFGVAPDAASGIRSGERSKSNAQAAFVRRDRPDGQRRWLADLPRLARQRLAAAGVHRVHGGTWCTVEDPSAFFSFRRDGRGGGATGRLAASIAIA